MADPAGRFSLAFDNPTLDWDVTWTALDQAHPNLVTSYTIDRGRQYELDTTDTGRATVDITDTDGILDPTNPSGPYYGKIEPTVQAAICRYNPVTDLWHTRFRGFVEELDYQFDPSQRVNKLVVSLVDIFEVLSRVEMIPVLFGDTPPADSAGQVYFAVENMDDRINDVLDWSFIPPEFRVVFSGNVELQPVVYSPGETAMTAIQEAADAEFPGVSNVYTDRLGRLAVHGRLAKFDPVGVHSGATPGSWLFNQWKAGDGAAVQASPTDTAQLRRFGFNRGLAKIINQALATPAGIADSNVDGQRVEDVTSRLEHGMRSWSAQNLITKRGLIDNSTDLVETKRFAQYYVANYAQPRNRVTDIGFRSIRPEAAGGPVTWHLLTEVDISDTLQVTVASPGGGGFSSDDYFVEGVHETARPLNPEYDDVELTLDLSPRAYFTTNPFPTPP